MTRTPATLPRSRHLRPLILGGMLSMVMVTVAVEILVPELFSLIHYWREPAEYVVPVAGFPASALRSTWGAPRPGGRKHRGADIFAPKGTPVVSATDGVVLSAGDNSLGGHVVHVVGEGHSIYYYAHLNDWATGLHRGQRVAAGELLGFVGQTGNAATTPPHLHFGVYRLSLAGLFGLDPVPMLVKARTIPRTGALVHGSI